MVGLNGIIEAMLTSTADISLEEILRTAYDCILNIIHLCFSEKTHGLNCLLHDTNDDAIL